ncbi:helix-turn-helix domain-containing protein [Cellulosimicrobium composti]|uniref:Helix-turn-helix domain-containing protein n=1 Tax=Cellulosimicrobium composti TaxID=2672572 RepID=A0ABX0BIU1_9MICO|nr:helix-turn-helix domain-containing protein [Cellulosimicrobium composti]NDO90726.1 helix-turn-helix domain-containing protein [Cellulosimicrobium composti]
MDVTSATAATHRSRGDGRPEPLLRHVIGGILRRARRAQGRTLVDVAAAARVSTAYLSEIERGRKEASSEVLAAVCGALGLRLVDLVARTGEELRPVAPVRVLSAVRERGALSAPRHPAPVGEPVRDLPVARAVRTLPSGARTPDALLVAA